MTNYHNYDDPVPCPYCNAPCHADFVDIDVAMIQCGPYFCYECGASEIGPELFDWAEKKMKYCEFEGKETEHNKYDENKNLIMKKGHPFSEIELKTKWYNSGKLSPYANTVNGNLVNHEEAKAAYNVGMLDEKKIPETD